MEALLKDLPLMGYDTLLDAVERGEISPRDIYVAHLQRRLDTVLDGIADPSADEVFAAMGTDIRVCASTRSVVPRLRAYVPQTARASWFVDPVNISRYLRHVVEDLGLSAGTANVADLQLINRILDFRIGKVRRVGMMTDVQRPRIDDLRDVSLRPEQLSRVLAGMRNETARRVAGVLVLTGIDLGPAHRLEARHLSANALTVPDTKNRARWRTIPLSPQASRLLHGQAVRHPSGPLFRISPSMVRTDFKRAADAAGVAWLRLKDLRHLFAEAYLKGGGTLEELRLILGHTKATTTMRYLHHTAIDKGRGAESMQAAAKALKLD
jgi:integrase